MTAVSTDSFINAELDFGLNMIRQVPANAQTVVSPLSVILALTMVQAGAKGRTRAQINEAISNGASSVDIQNFYSRLSQDVLNATDNVQTRIANAFYMDKRYAIEKQYEATIRKKYSAKVEALDFQTPKDTAQVIDKFISDTTEGKIKNMVNEQMVVDAFSLIVNAIYFKAKWLRELKKDLTKKAIFYCSENKQKEIEFMNEYQKSRLYAENDDMQVLTLPYKDTTYALSILLPKKRFALAALRNKISGATLRELLRQIEFMNEYEKNRLYAENDNMQVLTLPYKDTTYALSILLPKKRFALAALRNKISGATLRELLRQIEFMNEYEKNRLYAENDDMQVLTLPYKDTTYALSILLPKKRFALAAIRNKISGATLRELLRQVRMKFMTISIPKMKIETKFELKKALISMGITEMFTDNADLTGITKQPPLKVSDAAHRALIEVDEEGTVAAAATVITMVETTALRPQRKPITFIANHPFIIILTKNDSPIFTGQFIA